MSGSPDEAGGPPTATPETHALDAAPGLREQIVESAEFRTYLDGVRRYEVDGETWYLPWGDIPMDVDQTAYHWAIETGFPGSDRLVAAVDPGSSDPVSSLDEVDGRER